MKNIQKLALKIKEAGGELWVIGGFVREQLFRQAHPGFFIHESKDIDCEVYHISPERLEFILAEMGAVDFVGQQFGVYKLTIEGKTYDISYPRSDSIGRRPEVAIDPSMDKVMACRRRNFTCNTAMLNPLDGEVIDLFTAKQDIKDRILRITHQQTFTDDPLRPLIGMFLAGAYGFGTSPATEYICQEIVWRHSELPESRIWGEWWKWATRSVKPSQGLLFLKSSGWIKNYPELEILGTIPQDTEWHPEGNVWRHTLLATNEAARISRDWENREQAGIVVLAALCHDLDKAICTGFGNKDEVWPIDYMNDPKLSDATKMEIAWRVRDGHFRIISPGHDEGIEAVKFLNRIHCPHEIRDAVLMLVKTHMTHIQPARPKRLLNKLVAAKVTPLQWLTVVASDHSARPPLPVGTPVEALKLFEEMERVEPEQIKPIVMGRHLIERWGMKPGPEMGKLLKEVFEIQLDGGFSTLEEGLFLIARKLEAAGKLNK